MAYYNKQKECKEAVINTKGFCKYSKFYYQACRCTLHKPCYCPFAWKIYMKGEENYDNPDTY